MTGRLFWDRHAHEWRTERPAPPPSAGPSVISDNCEFRSQADGRIYTSKRAYRSDLRARGLIEVGNERQGPSRPQIDLGGVGADIKRAMGE